MRAIAGLGRENEKMRVAGERITLHIGDIGFASSATLWRQGHLTSRFPERGAHKVDKGKSPVLDGLDGSGAPPPRTGDSVMVKRIMGNDYTRGGELSRGLDCSTGFEDNAARSSGDSPCEEDSKIKRHSS